MPDRPCPKCAQSMRAAHFGPVELDICLRCAAVWFDFGELPQVVQAGPDPISRLSEKIRPASADTITRPVGAPRCPCCRIPMNPTEYSSMPGVPLDACPICQGFWVGTEALTRIAAYLRRVAEQAAAAQAKAAPPAPAASFFTPPPAEAASPPPPPAPPAPQPAPAAFAAQAKAAPAATAVPPASQRRSSVTDEERCPGCGERNPERAAVCWACGRMLQGVASGQCPRCTGVLRELDSDKVKYKACEDCGGVWLEESRLGALLLQSPEQKYRVRRQVEKTRTGRVRQINPGLMCPHCELIMFGAPIGMLTQQRVATCPRCRACFVDQSILNELLT